MSGKGQGKCIEFLRSLVGHTGDECVPWPFSKNHKGYGELGFNGRSWKANRLMCILAHGEPPTPKHQAAHNCGSGHLSCVNPRHLEWKTNYENQMDRVEHGTMPKIGRPRRLLTAEQIEEVRALKGKVAQYDLAKRFGVKPGCIEYWQSHNKPPAMPSAETVQAILAIGRSKTQAEIAAELAVSVNTVRNVLGGRSWRRDVA